MRWFIVALLSLALESAHTSDAFTKAGRPTEFVGQTLFVDVRTAEEFATGHFPGAINIPHEDIVRGIREYNLHKDQTLLLYCRSGNRSGLAESSLQSVGFSRVKNVGGLKALLAATGRTAALRNN